MTLNQLMDSLLKVKGASIYFLSGEELGDELIWYFGMDEIEKMGITREDVISFAYIFLEKRKNEN